MASDTVKERIERFKELIKSGYSVSKARRESKLHPREYKKYYDEIWSDPDMKPYSPRKKSEDPQTSQSQNSQSQASQNSQLSLGILEGALEGLIKGLLRCFGPEKLGMFIGMKHIGIKP